MELNFCSQSPWKFSSNQRHSENHVRDDQELTQFQEMITADARPGIYHGTNGGQASWFELAKTIFYLVGANSNRIKPINSIEYDAVIKRPKFAVLGHDAWRLEGIKPMRNWHEALADSIPLIFHSVQEE